MAVSNATNKQNNNKTNKKKREALVNAGEDQAANGNEAAETFADKILDFHAGLSYMDPLPPGFGVLNPIQETDGVLELMGKFYKKYYDDYKTRKFIVGINPGRHGAGTTGIPFTDSKRLRAVCGINSDLPSTHEVSALFIYDMISAYGGVEKFYGEVYIQSMFPLALVREGRNGGWVNCNYYDDPRLIESLMPYMRRQLKRQVGFGVDQSTAFVLGKKNAEYFKKLNGQEHLFEKMVVLPHPRYIQQYRSKDKELFIDMYINALQG